MEKRNRKKYVLPEASVDFFKQHALNEGFFDQGKILQRDWSPDFDENQLKQNGLLLRIRKEFLSAGTDRWIVTLKKSSISNGIHQNLELEATNDNLQNYSKIESILSQIINQKLVLKKIIIEDKPYLEKIKMTKVRMLSEKKRHNFVKKGVVLSFDEFPVPLGHYIEVEVDTDENDLLSWEKILKLASLHTEERNYGQLIKDTLSSRKLVF